jgi:Fe-S-cluster containining protein
MDDAPSAFECRRCGHCCQGDGGIVLTAKDQLRLALHLGMSLEAFLSAHTSRKGEKVHLGVRSDAYCVFFENGCGVHPARPDICRAWPYFRGNLLDSSSWELAQDYCKGINGEFSHEQFVKEGLATLKDAGVGVTGDPDAPSALKLDGIKTP